MHPAPLQAYATYPYKSENYLRLPADARTSYVNYYRTDMFCNEDEQKTFQAKYSEKLPCTPEEMDDVDWDMFEKIGEFFQRKKGDMLAGKPADDDFYGIAYQAGKAYDFSIDADQRLHLAVWRRTSGTRPRRPKGQAEGVVNSPEAGRRRSTTICSLTPVHAAGGQDRHAWTSSRPTSCSAKARSRSNIEWIGFAESSINPETSKVADKVAFAQAPGLKGPTASSSAGPTSAASPSCIMTWTDDDADQGGGRLREVVAVARDPAHVRRAGRPERHQVGLRRSEVRHLPSVEPHLGAEPRLAEGRLAHPGVLRAAGAAAGAVSTSPSPASRTPRPRSTTSPPSRKSS